MSLNVTYILLQHIFLMLFFTIYFDWSSREDSFIILFVITIQLAIVNILEIVYFRPPPAFNIKDMELWWCIFKFDSPQSPTFEYSSLIAYIAVDFMMSNKLKNKLLWVVLFLTLNVVISGLIGFVVLYLGIAYIGSIIYGWMLGLVIAPLI